MELPASFVDYTRSLLGEEEYEKLAVALQQEPPVSIRFNNEKWKMQDEGYLLSILPSAEFLGRPKGFIWTNA